MNSIKNINIFIVDDNKFLSLALKLSIESAFENRKIEIFLFETGESCMKRFMELNPELVVLYYYLNSESQNSMNGHQVLENKRIYNN